MYKIIIILLLAIFISGCKTTAKKTDLVTQLGYRIPKTFLEGEGLLVIRINLQAMTKNLQLLNKPEGLYSYTLKNIDTGFIKKVKHQPRMASVISLPAGRYCIDWLSPYVNIVLPHCKAPFYDVEYGSVKNSGVTDIGIYYSASSDLIRHFVFKVRHPRNFLNTKLTNLDKERLNRYYDKHAKTDTPKTFYVQSPFGSNRIIRLYKNYAAELEIYSEIHSTFSTYTKGTWKYVKDEMHLSFGDGSLTYRLKEVGSLMIGLVDISNRSSISNKFDTHWNWLIVGSTKIRNKVNKFSLLDHPHPVISRGIEYPESAYQEGTQGEVKITYDLELSRNRHPVKLYNPTNIVVKSNSGSVKKEDINKVLSVFAKNNFSLPIGEKVSNLEETIIFSITNNIPGVDLNNNAVSVYESIN